MIDRCKHRLIPEQCADCNPPPSIRAPALAAGTPIITGARVMLIDEEGKEREFNPAPGFQPAFCARCRLHPVVSGKRRPEGALARYCEKCLRATRYRLRKAGVAVTEAAILEELKHKNERGPAPGRGTGRVASAGKKQ